MSNEHDSLAELEERIGYTFADRRLLVRALTHKSYTHEARDHAAPHNETFEFLGDSVLGFVIGDLLFRRFTDLDEGAMSKMKAWLVSSPVLARKAQALGMGDALRLGVGEEKSGGRRKDSLLGNLFEAVVAGIYLDGGYEPVAMLIRGWFEKDVESIDADDLLFHDYKTALQEVAQGLGLPLPGYEVIDEVGPDHEKRFVVEVGVGGLIAARGEGGSKKEAQQEAAKHALSMRDRLEETAGRLG